MPTPTPSWNLVRVFATWNNMDGTKKAGSYKITLDRRITSATDDVIIPPGVFATGSLSTTAGQPSIDIMVPAVDDPDITPQDFAWQVEVNFNDKSDTEKFFIQPRLTSGQVNLRQVAVPSNAVPFEALKFVGVPGGLAKLNANGKVVDATGVEVTGTGTGTGGPVTADQINDSTAIGRAIITAATSTAARAAIGAGTSSLTIGTTSTTAKAGDYQPTAANISNATAVGRSVLTAADATAARTAIAAASATQGAKADAAVPAADLQASVESFLNLGVRIDQTLAYNDPALNTKLAALPVGTVVAIVGPEVV